MAVDRNPTAASGEPLLIDHSHGLRSGALSPLETLAQSISSIAPTAGPTVLIPLAFALSGNGTWFAYLLATVALCLVAMNISVFARDSASPGSLYAYAASVLPGPVGRLSAWALLIAYIATASAVTGGFTNYANLLLHALFGIQGSGMLLTAVTIILATWIAYRDVKISARLMLAFEVISVSLISLIVVATLWKHGPRLDTDQFTLHGASPGPIRLGLVIAIFSFVGFESATTLGLEAKDPLRTVPRAVILSAIFAGIFFMLCAYTEILGFKTAHQDLSTNSAPLRLLAERTGLGRIDPLIDLGAVFSFFACALSCITAAARVLLIMARATDSHTADSPMSITGMQRPEKLPFSLGFFPSCHRHSLHNVEQAGSISTDGWARSPPTDLSRHTYWSALPCPYIFSGEISFRGARFCCQPRRRC